MFSGLIRELGEVKSFSNNLLTIKAKYRPKIGDSIAVNGACLTVVKIEEKLFSVELSKETTDLIVTEKLKGRVHIEPAMRVSDRLEGHILQGHIDCQGEVIKIVNQNRTKDFYIKIPKEFIKFVIPKGSIAVDGVSLTINEVFEDSFRLTIIPHTLTNTIINDYRVGEKVNIETDIFARYLYHIFSKKEAISWDKIDNILAFY